MALSSQRASITILSAHQGKYDVFLSFRGETRGTFTDHLFKTLKDRGINVFRDHELERGIDLPSILSNAIKESKIVIIVLSPDYASSTWCLQELSKAFEQMKDWKTIQRIIPIFYNVEPSDVRKQRGTFDESFKMHEENLIEHKRLQQWKTALTDVSGITGWNSKDWNYETDFIAKIAEEVYNKLVCACCQMRIDDEELYFSCMGAVWHRECFRCNACNLPFTDNEFWKCGHHPYHKSCYKERFDVCKRFILENSGSHTEYMEHLQKDYTGRASEVSDAHCYGVIASEITTKDFSNEIKLSETLSAPVPVLEPETENLTTTKRDSGAREPGLRRFSDPDFAVATKNSPNEGKLGGGFGAVYRSLSAGLDIVAVKKISRGFGQATKECIEKVKDNSLRLRNLLQVKGRFLLLYLFMANGILDFHLSAGTSLLHCGACLIVMSLAFLLPYFHERYRRKQLVVHLSIKSSNIHRVLLGSSFNFEFMRDGILYFLHFLKISSLPWAAALCFYTLLTECEGCLQQGVVHGDSQSNNILLDSIFNCKFMPNGTLDSQAFYGKKSLLDYTVRPFISIGSAYALFYLHHMWKQFMVQRYYKLNIFWDICRLSSDGFGYQSYLFESTSDGTHASDLYGQIYPRLAWATSYIIFPGCAYTWFYVLQLCWKQFVVHGDNVLLDSSSNVKAMPNGNLDSLLYCPCTCILYMGLTSAFCYLCQRWRQYVEHRERIHNLSGWTVNMVRESRFRVYVLNHKQGSKTTGKRSASRMRKDFEIVQLVGWVSKLDRQGRLLLVLAAERLLMMIQCHLQLLLQIRIHQPHDRIQIQAHSL